ncbi:MAG: hypothetical protein PHH69_02620 [Candidatus Omnitrophica bacterium]|nr:hypothetical protein [Candidatus Omnitrophota bacterium]
MLSLISRCHRELVWLPKSRQPKTIIAGQGRSGTTFLFFVIKKSSPYSNQMRCLFEPKKYVPDSGYHSKQAVLAKVIISEKPDYYNSFKHFDKKIMLARDPRDIIISRLLYEIAYVKIWDKHPDEIRRWLNILQEKENKSGAQSVLELWRLCRGAGPTKLKLQFDARFGVVTEFFRKNPEYFLLKYEDLINGRISGLENYLGYKLLKDVEVDGEYSRVIRTRGEGAWRNWFTEEDIAFFKPLFSGFMEVFGYDIADWDLHKEQKILPEHCSGYVLRVLSEKRRAAGMPEFTGA